MEFSFFFVSRGTGSGTGCAACGDRGDACGTGVASCGTGSSSYYSSISESSDATLTALRTLK